jgi:GNAT superfamily N-acetyltransferase
MKIEIREYAEADYAACRSLWGELAQHHAEIYEDPSIAGDDPGRGFDKYLKLASRLATWCAEDEGKIVGITGLLEHMGEDGVCEIEPVVVSLDYRRKGLGSKLIEHVGGEAKRRGFRFLTIRPELRNEEAFALYMRLGFNLVGGIELFQDLMPESGRKWKSGVKILGHNLGY